MRLLIPISFSFSIRYIVRTGLLEKLKAFCTPVIAIVWEEEELVKELRDTGYEVHILPRSRKEPSYLDVRKKIDIWFKHFQLKSPSTKIQQNYLSHYEDKKSKAIKKLRVIYNVCNHYVPGTLKRLLSKEKNLLQSKTNYQDYDRFIDQLNIDAVFTLTPFHTQEDILLRACYNKRKRMLTAILSFDNLTKRGWIPVPYDAYMLWNQYNKQELFRIYPFTKSKSVYITGAPQFDFYFQPDNLLSRDEWKAKVGIPKDESRKIILYAGGPQLLFPAEPYILKDIIDSIELDLIRDAFVLFRCHPMDDVERWRAVIGDSPNIVYDSSWTGKENVGFTNITSSDIKKLCSTLAYSDVHVNVCSTMTVDGSAYSKPQIGPAYIPGNPKLSAALKKMYSQEHFLPVLSTGCLLLAESKEQLTDHINQSLKNPIMASSKSHKVLQEIITYTDGKCVDRVVSVIKQELNKL